MELLKDCLEKYKDITAQLLASVENDDFDGLQAHLNNRQKIIDTINQYNYTQQEFQQICKELQLEKLEERIQLLMENKRNELKGHIQEVSANKNARKIAYKEKNIEIS